jgi:hypothetical protein
MKALLLLVLWGWAEAPQPLALVSAAPLLDAPSLDTDLERLYTLADDLGFRMQGKTGELRDAVTAAQGGLSRPSVWRRPRLEAPRLLSYRAGYTEEWGGELPPGDVTLSPFFRHNGQLFLIIRRDDPAPTRWASLWHRLRWRVPPQKTYLYRIRPDGRAVIVLQMPAPAGKKSALSVIQTSANRFVVATPGKRLHRVVLDFRPE